MVLKRWGESGEQPTSDLLFQAGYDIDCVLQDGQFRLRLIRRHMNGAHAAKLLERFVYIANSHPESGGRRRKRIVSR